MSKKLNVWGLAVMVLLLAGSPVLAGSESGEFSIGAFGGGAFSIVNQAVSGSRTSYPETEFNSGKVFGGSIMYRFPSSFALELNAKRLSMDLEEAGENFGTLNMTPVMIMFKVQGMPRGGSGFTGHADIGGGVSFNSFDEGPYIDEVEKTTGVDYDIETDNSFVFELGAGGDYFFTKNISANLDGRIMLGNVRTDGWQKDVETFHASNVQVLFGIRYWH